MPLNFNPREVVAFHNTFLFELQVIATSNVNDATSLIFFAGLQKINNKKKKIRV